jgi:putative two-component system response regulator
MLGYAEHEVVGQPLELILTRGEDLVSAVAWPSEGLLTLPSTSGVQIEVECRRRDGSSFPAEVNVSEMQVGQRRITVACIRDISDRVEAAGRERRHAETLRRDAQRDRAAFDEAPIGSIIASSNGQVERVNQAICAMTGYTPDELIGTHLLELTQPEDGSKTQRIGESVLSGMTPTVRYEKRYVLRDGSVLEAYIALTAIHDDDDQIVQLFAQIVDVTAARRTARELKQAQVEVLDRLAAAAEFRDDDTGQHTRRVGELSVAIARVIELPTTQLELMRLAAPLHDLGKIAVPDAILGKRGKLTEDEFKQMQAHTTIGATLLAGGDNLLLQMAEEIALTHHEKWDGSGYPAGLVGDAIPIAGRIVAVAHPFTAIQGSLEQHGRDHRDDQPSGPAFRPGRPRRFPGCSPRASRRQHRRRPRQPKACRPRTARGSKRPPSRPPSGPDARVYQAHLDQVDLSRLGAPRRWGAHHQQIADLSSVPAPPSTNTSTPTTRASG